MAFLGAKIGTGKHLGFVLLAWAVFFMLAAWVLPPLDSHLRPTPLNPPRPSPARIPRGVGCSIFPSGHYTPPVV
jgi:hypothetical protein